MAGVVVLDHEVAIPLALESLGAFRRWALSDAFPESGRIDFVAGRIEVDMSPEDFFCHGTLKAEIFGGLFQIVKQRKLGHVVTDRTRVSCPAVNLSAEPDIVFVSHETLASGRVRLIPKSTGEPGRYVELEGAPDLVVEIISDRSVNKDTKLLPGAYFRAGVREYWLADARREPHLFQIHQRGETRFEPLTPNADGSQRSGVFGCCFRLDGQRDEQGHWAFDLY